MLFVGVSHCSGVDQSMNQLASDPISAFVIGIAEAFQPMWLIMRDHIGAQVMTLDQIAEFVVGHSLMQCSKWCMSFDRRKTARSIVAIGVAEIIADAAIDHCFTFLKQLPLRVISK